MAISIIPQPQQLTMLDGSFVLTDSATISAQPELQSEAMFLAEALRPATGYTLPVTIDTAGEIVMRLQSGMPAEGYRLTVRADRVELDASDNSGIFYGIQSMRQLLGSAVFSSCRQNVRRWTMPCVVIEDAPRFKWRGTMLDVSRHLVSVESVKRYIDRLAIHKLNVFHWHLVDDQGWRLEIKRYPKLTEIGAWRKEIGFASLASDSDCYDEQGRYGGFFTQEEVRDIVAYAARRHVTVVPEIELPGHCSASICAYPELGSSKDAVEVPCTGGICTNIYNLQPATFEFLENVFREVFELFPATFIHIGGDEAKKDQWIANPEIQARIMDLGLRDEHELQSWFVRHFDRFLSEHGRRLIGWDEILEGGLAPRAAVMSWRGEQGGITAAQAGHDVVMSPRIPCYFDYRQSTEESEPHAMGESCNSLEDVYRYEPIPAELASEYHKHVLGAQCNVWTEFIPNEQHRDYMTYPRLCAFSEAVWTPVENRNWDGFRPRMLRHLEVLRQLHIDYRYPSELEGV